MKLTIDKLINSRYSHSSIEKTKICVSNLLKGGKG